MKTVFCPCEKKKSLEFFVFTLAEVLLSSNTFQEGHSPVLAPWPPLSPRGLLELSCQGLPHASVIHGSAKVAQKRVQHLLCHCHGPVSAELKKEEVVAHGFLVLSAHVSSSTQCGEAVGPRVH